MSQRLYPRNHAGDRVPNHLLTSVRTLLTSVRTGSASKKTIVRVPNPPTKIECKFTTMGLARDEVIASIVSPPPTIANVALRAIANFSRSIVSPSNTSCGRRFMFKRLRQIAALLDQRDQKSHVAARSRVPSAQRGPPRAKSRHSFDDDIARLLAAFLPSLGDPGRDVIANPKLTALSI